MANGFIDGIGYPMNGGLAAGIQMAKIREAKDKEQKLGQAMNRYALATDDEGKRTALSEMALIDPSFTQGFYKQAKGSSGFGNSELGLILDVYENPDKYDEKTRQVVADIVRVKSKDPSLRGEGSYESEVGKQQAQGGQPYVYNRNAQSLSYDDTEMQEPVKMVTASELAADKKAAEEDAKNRVAFEKDLAQSKARLDAYDALRSDVEQNANILGKMNAINYGIGEWTDGLFGLENDERQKYAYIKRQIGEMRSNLINRAKQAGQTGINTAKEIEIAAAGIDFDMSAPSLIGAIEQLKKQELRLDNAMAEYYGMKTGYEQPQENVISVDEWLKQGR